MQFTISQGQKYTNARTRAATAHSLTLPISHTHSTRTNNDVPTRARQQMKKNAKCNVCTPDLARLAPAKRRCRRQATEQNTKHGTRHAGTDNMLVQALKAPYHARSRAHEHTKHIIDSAINTRGGDTHTRVLVASHTLSISQYISRTLDTNNKPTAAGQTTSPHNAQEAGNEVLFTRTRSCERILSVTCR